MNYKVWGYEKKNGWAQSRMKCNVAIEMDGIMQVEFIETISGDDIDHWFAGIFFVGVFEVFRILNSKKVQNPNEEMPSIQYKFVIVVFWRCNGTGK